MTEPGWRRGSTGASGPGPPAGAGEGTTAGPPASAGEAPPAAGPAAPTVRPPEPPASDSPFRAGPSRFRTAPGKPLPVPWTSPTQPLDPPLPGGPRPLAAPSRPPPLRAISKPTVPALESRPPPALPTPARLTPPSPLPRAAGPGSPLPAQPRHSPVPFGATPLLSSPGSLAGGRPGSWNGSPPATPGLSWSGVARESSAGLARPPPRFGKFEILQLLGRGGMAEVFKARYAEGPRTGTLVALKRLAGHASRDPEAIDLFTGEGDIARLLRHPNLVEMLEAGFVDDVFFLAMEFVDGRDLAHLLNRCKERRIFLPAHFSVHIARRVLSALSFAHTALGPSGRPLNIVHCDVSPANVFLSRNGDIKLGDFGVARVAALGETAAGATVWGKLAYLAPEMLQRSPLTAAIDLWGVAAMLYEALTNQRLINGADNEKLQAALRRLHVEPVERFRDDLPPGLCEVVRRALSRDPALRLGTAVELDAALAPFHDEQSGGALGIAGLIRGLFR